VPSEQCELVLVCVGGAVVIVVEGETADVVVVVDGVVVKAAVVVAVVCSEHAARTIAVRCASEWAHTDG